MEYRVLLHSLPIFVFVCFALTFVSTFIISVQNGHVFPALPYISDTGTLPPESCIFAQFLNLIAFALAACVYIRHLQIEQFSENGLKFSGALVFRWNRTATICGFLSALGMDIVANFQVSNVWQIHYLGASLCFFGGTFYFVLQTIFSYYMCETRKFVFYQRVFLCTSSVFWTILAIGPGIVAKMYFKGSDTRHWKVTDGGFYYHMLSAVGEWMLAISLGFLTLTFLPEFRRLSAYAPVLKIEGISADT